MDRDFIFGYWHTDINEQVEQETYDVDFLLKHLRSCTGESTHNILQAGCGFGRIAVPLAEAGHKVVGFDVDEFALLRFYRRMFGLSNIECFKADALKPGWGTGYDVVVVGGNLLNNIETEDDYAEAQKAMIANAADALRVGGHLWLDFDLHFAPHKVFNRLGETSYFGGRDSLGTHGRTVSYGSVYNPATRIVSGANHVELTTNNGELM
ncbi:MAG: class I SAM-dependent methyltransferase, partial [Clostridiales bacterium]|nr:class I SAM-dependent methyltransferase [Clostridiales bacterium]